VPLNCALEIGEKPDITPLPNIPDWILGISNIRGEIVSMVDLFRFLRFLAPYQTNAQRFIVVQNQHIKIGIIVDQILGMISISGPETEIQKSPYVDGDIAVFTRGVIPYEKKSINIIDIEKMLSSPRMMDFIS
jgi:purine-binding chemotaxis protein CheW